MQHPPGTIGIISGDLTRYAGFSQSLLNMVLPTPLVPPGTTVIWVEGIFIAEAVNTIIRQMYGEWVMVWADDHLFPPDIVLRLLDRQVAVVAPLCFLRRPPYLPSLFWEVGSRYIPYPLQELDQKTGLLPVDAMGGPGVLLRRAVLDALGDPWFECMPGQRTVPHEDLYFFSKCRKAGFQPYVDLDVIIDHYFPGRLRPRRLSDGRYAVEVLHGPHALGLLPPPAYHEGQNNASFRHP